MEGETLARKLSIVFAMAITGVSALSAPIPSGAQQAPRYFTARVGDTLVYRQDDGFEYSKAISEVERSDESILITIGLYVRGELLRTEKFSCSAQGMFLIGSGLAGRLSCRDPEALFLLPHKDGGGWELKYRTTKDEVVVKYSTYGPDQVEVPAGKFRAIRVVETYTIGGMAMVPTTYWYGEGVGLIKRGVGPRKQGEATEIVEVLKTFTPAK